MLKFIRDIKQLKSEMQYVKAALLNIGDIDDYKEWKRMSDANRENAAKQGHWYLNSKTDVLLLEQVISEINKNEDLCALLTTADGTTLSLRVHSQPNKQNKSTNYSKYSEEE